MNKSSDVKVTNKSNQKGSSKPQGSGFMDSILLLLSLAILLGGIVGFYYFESQAITVVRALGLLVAVAVSLLVAAQTAKGRNLLAFLRNADIERRKIIWPTRQETIQTTIIVLIVSVIVSLILFAFDSLLSVGIRALMGA